MGNDIHKAESFIGGGSCWLAQSTLKVLGNDCAVYEIYYRKKTTNGWLEKLQKVAFQFTNVSARTLDSPEVLIIVLTNGSVATVNDLWQGICSLPTANIKG